MTVQRARVAVYVFVLALILFAVYPKISGATLPDLYDQQSFLSFSHNVGPSIYYYVNATVQNDKPYGPAYLLNGLTDTGCWYQIGLSRDWEGTLAYAFGIPSPFTMSYQVFCDGWPVFPANGGGGLKEFTGEVNPGDKVELGLQITADNKVSMFAEDQNTGAYADVEYSAENASTFVGTPLSSSNNYGFFTGLMTEQYYTTPTYSNQREVSYSPALPTGSNLGPVWMSEDEYCTRGYIGSGCGGIYDSEISFPILPKSYYIKTTDGDGTLAGEEYFGYNGTLITGVNDIGGIADTKPYGVVFSPDGLYAYVDNQGSDTVSVIDVEKNWIVNTISLGYGQTPWGIAISPDGSRLYVATQQGESATIDIIATPNRTIIGSIPIPASGLDEPSSVAPQDMVVNPQGTYLFGRATGQEIEKISLTTNTFVGNYPSPFTFSSSIAIDPTGTYLYAPNIWHGDSILIGLAILEVINAQTLTAGQNVTIPYQTGVNGHGVAIDSNGDGYWTYSGADVNYDPNPMSYLADLSGQTVFSVSGSELYNIAIDPNSGAAYVVGCGSSGAATYWPDPTSGEIYSTTGLVIALPNCPSVIGNAPWENSYSFNPESLAIDPNANLSVGYVADYNVGIIPFSPKNGSEWNLN